MVLSVIIPAFNEENTIYSILARVSAVELMNDLQKELIIVDDCSTDRTHAEVERFCQDSPGTSVVFLRHKKNKGKGAAVRTGIQAATGDFIVIQDADLEYDPREYNLLLKPVLEDFADVVYGSRFVGSQPHRVLFYFHSAGNKFLTFLSNLLTNINITDMETGYKLFRSGILKNIRLVENGFGFEAEVTAKVSRIPKIRIYEIGVSYYGRTYSEGKKVNWIDGVVAIYCIVKYNIFSRR